jgi:2-keto-myo-inositol isomerase
MQKIVSRRDVLAGAMALPGAALVAGAPAEDSGRATAGAEPGICLNTATIRAQKVGIVRALELAAAAGFRGVEPWIDEIDAYERAGGAAADIGKRAADLGLELPNAIGFFEWMVDDDERRARAVEEARRRMETLAKIGCARMAAPPAGNVKGVDPLRAAERYRALLEIGDRTGVVPALELWGASPALSRLGQGALVILEANHPKACMVLDVFHLYRSGSGLDGVRFLSPAAIGIFHVNDYPAAPPREEAKDSHRIMPGDGVAPLGKLFRDLRSIGYRGMVSLELFNQEYYRRDAAEVVREGFRKMKAALDASR